MVRASEGLISLMMPLPYSSTLEHLVAHHQQLARSRTTAPETEINDVMRWKLLSVLMLVIATLVGCASGSADDRARQQEYETRLREYNEYALITKTCRDLIEGAYKATNGTYEKIALTSERYRCERTRVGASTTLRTSPMYNGFIAVTNLGEGISYRLATDKITLEQANTEIDGLAPKYLSQWFKFGNPTTASVPKTGYTGTVRPGCSESGSCYGDISTITGMPRTTYVNGYTRSNGTQVRGYYRSSGRR
jgi:hypothetical protein